MRSSPAPGTCTSFSRFAAAAISRVKARVTSTSTSARRGTMSASSPTTTSHGAARRARTAGSSVAEKVPAKATRSMPIPRTASSTRPAGRSITPEVTRMTRRRPLVYDLQNRACSGGAAMPINGSTEARKLRASLKHPIIDADGHWLEYGPVMRDEFRRIGGDAAVEALAAATDRVPSALRMSLPERRRRRVGMEAFWGSPSENVLDRATAMLPRLMHERLDDLGLDFCVVYPTTGLGFHRMPDPRLRRAICRAYNVFTADQFRGLEDRLIPAAIIPMYTPEEAIEELEFASKQLGYKVMMVGGLMRRKVPALAEENPDASKVVDWYDVIGIDSDH